jgi:predicted ATPase
LDFGLRPAEVAQSYFSRDAGRITQIRVEEEQVRETRAAFDQPQRLYFREYAGSFPHPTADGLARFVRGWRFMDVDVSSARRASPDLVPEGVSALLPDASNLSAVLYSLGNRSPERFEEIEYRLGRAIGFPQSIETEKVATLGGSGEARYGFRELAFPGRVIPPEAMSDGTIRLLANLTAVLGDPDARLICIEEPDHGLHPHLMLRLADAMRAAAAAEPAEGFVPPQVLVVTHSPDFLDCFNLAAEAGYLAVYVAERSIEDGKTTFRSTEAADLQPWLEEYRLGEAVRRNIL